MRKALTILLVFGILVFGFLFFKAKQSTQNNVPLTETDSSSRTITDGDKAVASSGSQTTQSVNNIKYEQLPPNLRVIATSNVNTSTGSTDKYFVITGEKYEGMGGSYCGFGGQESNPVPKCIVYVADLSGNLRKVLEWPTDSTIKKYPDSFLQGEYRLNNLFYPGLVKGISDDNNFDGDMVKFTTQIQESCAYVKKEFWNVDYKTGEVSKVKTEIIDTSNGC